MTNALGENAFELTADDGGPRRPSLEDLGGATLEDADPPPDKSRMLYKDLCNGEQIHLALAMGAIPLLEVEVRFVSNAPVVYAVWSPNSGVTTATITPTDNGNGDTTLTWPENTLPPTALAPKAYVNGSSPGMISAEYVTARSVRVRTERNGGLLDLPFTLVVR